MIKRNAVLCGLLLIPATITALGFGQIVENSSKPSAKDAGRVLKLTEAWRITDKGGEFFFQFPNNLQVADDRTIFIADQKELLRFSPEGRFIKNIVRPGQGPGEIGEYFTYFLFGHDVFIQDMESQRFWRADFDGILQNQINLVSRDYRGFLGALPDGFLFLKTVWPPMSERTGKPMEVTHIVTFVSRDGLEQRDIGIFRPKDFLSPQSAMSLTAKITVLSPDLKLLYAFYGGDYMIEVVDIASGRTVRRFTRAYPRVRHVERDFEADFRKKYGSPKLEFEIDVKSLNPVGDHVWVETSTDDKAKGRLIDVFDRDGRFIDSFYLGAGKQLMAVREGYLFCQEKNEDETITIVKYRVDK